MAAELLTLEQAKNYLRVAEAYIDGCVGTGYKDKANYENDEEYEKGRRIAALLLKRIVSDMYEVRSTTVGSNTKTDNITKTILEKLANVGA